MKNRYILIYLVVGIILLSGSSCTKNIVDDFNPIGEKWESIDAFITSANSQKTVAIPEASSEFIVRTNSALIRFSAESIVEEGTDAPIQGPIEMVYTEFSSYKELFLNNIDTEDLSGETLYSRYLIDFQLKQGNKLLKLDDLKPAYIYFDTDDNVLDHEYLFYWEENQDSDGWFVHANIDVYEDSWDFELDGTEYIGSGFKMLIRNTGLTTLAEHEHLKYDVTSDYGLVTMSVEDIYKNSNTKLFIARKEDFAMIPLDLLNGNYVHTQIRKDEEVIIFGLTVVDDKIYFGRKNIIVGDINTYDLIFNEVSYIEAIEELQRM